MLIGFIEDGNADGMVSKTKCIYLGDFNEGEVSTTIGASKSA